MALEFSYKYAEGGTHKRITYALYTDQAI